MEALLKEPQHLPTADARRGIALRTFGRRHGPITRLVSPSGTGEAIKPFVFLDRAEVRYTGKPLFGIHPHSGIATLTVVLDGAMAYEDTTVKKGSIGAGRYIAPESVQHEGPVRVLLGEYLGYYSVHTSAQALERGEAEIERIGEQLRNEGRL